MGVRNECGGIRAEWQGLGEWAERKKGGGEKRRDKKRQAASVGEAKWVRK